MMLQSVQASSFTIVLLFTAEKVVNNRIHDVSDGDLRSKPASYLGTLSSRTIKC